MTKLIHYFIERFFTSGKGYNVVKNVAKKNNMKDYVSFMNKVNNHFGKESFSEADGTEQFLKDYSKIPRKAYSRDSGRRKVLSNYIINMIKNNSNPDTLNYFGNCESELEALVKELE